MTKPREKTREELQAEIEDGKKKIRQFENREKMLRQKLSKSERNSRSRSPFSPTGDFHDRTSKIIMWRVSSIKRSSARMLCPPTKSSAFIFGTSRSDLKGGKPVAGDQSGVDDQAQRLRVDHLRFR